MSNRKRRAPYRRAGILASLLALSFLALSACAPADEEPAGVANVEADPGATEIGGLEGEPAPDFRLLSLGGDEISPSDYAGDVVLIDFWATWCGPCHAQAEILQQLWQDLEGKGVHFLAVSLGEPEETVRSFVERNPYPYPVLIDPEDRLSIDLGIYVLPTLMVIDRDGRVVFREPGVSDEETLRRVLFEAGVEHPAMATS